jgi:hypothetical protein
MAGAARSHLAPLPNRAHRLDIHYTNLHRELIETFKELGLVA